MGIGEKCNCDGECVVVLCKKCGTHQVAHEMEIMGTWYPVAGYCNNKECELEGILVA